MRTIRHVRRSTKNPVEILHVETEGCIVNIHIGLSNSEGHRLTAVEVLPDRYIGEEWDLAPGAATNTRVIGRQKVEN